MTPNEKQHNSVMVLVRLKYHTLTNSQEQMVERTKESNERH